MDALTQLQIDRLNNACPALKDAQIGTLAALVLTMPMIEYPTILSSPTRVVTTTYPILENSEHIYFKGSIQKQGTDYSISGNTITFSFDVTDEDDLFIHYLRKS